MHILPPETDNCPSWICGRERMTVENISWSISTKECSMSRGSSRHKRVKGVLYRENALWWVDTWTPTHKGKKQTRRKLFFLFIFFKCFISLLRGCWWHHTLRVIFLAGGTQQAYFQQNFNVLWASIFSLSLGKLWWSLSYLILLYLKIITVKFQVP